MTEKAKKKIAIITSGGDAPGMNAAIRSVVRTALYYKMEAFGFYGGYQGIIKNEYKKMNQRSVANIIQYGGTILKSGRSLDFMKPEFRKVAADNLKALNIDALVCIGGDGSLTGAQLLFEEQGIPYIGIPGTIDNDIADTDFTIGFDTAINTALDAIDRIRDTAASHDRLFIVEVMGHSSGFIAAAVGLAGGAEEVFVPEQPFHIEKVIKHILDSEKKGKKSSILIAAEGAKPGRAYDLAENIRKHSSLVARVCVLGHIQRGGKPSASDRILASRMGAAAVEALIKGHNQAMIGIEGAKLKVCHVPQLLKTKKHVDQQLLQLTNILSL